MTIAIESFDGFSNSLQVGAAIGIKKEYDRLGPKPG
jgi:hypothetical protein